MNDLLWYYTYAHGSISSLTQYLLEDVVVILRLLHLNKCYGLSSCAAIPEPMLTQIYVAIWRRHMISIIMLVKLSDLSQSDRSN